MIISCSYPKLLNVASYIEDQFDTKLDPKNRLQRKILCINSKCPKFRSVQGSGHLTIKQSETSTNQANEESYTPVGD